MKKILLVIVVLLAVIASPTIFSGVELVSEFVQSKINENKSEYCTRTYPRTITPAISEEELRLEVKKILNEDTDGAYLGMSRSSMNRHNLPVEKWLFNTLSGALKDRINPAAYYDVQKNTCVGGGADGKELPWYTI